MISMLPADPKSWLDFCSGFAISRCHFSPVALPILLEEKCSSLSRGYSGIPSVFCGAWWWWPHSNDVDIPHELMLVAEVLRRSRNCSEFSKRSLRDTWLRSSQTPLFWFFFLFFFFLIKCLLFFFLLFGLFYFFFFILFSSSSFWFSFRVKWPLSWKNLQSGAYRVDSAIDCDVIVNWEKSDNEKVWGNPNKFERIGRVKTEKPASRTMTNAVCSPGVSDV